MRTYELMFIVRPDITDEDLDKLVSTLETQATNAGATVKNIERMGKRRLAYTVRKFNDGIYILFTLEGLGPVVKEIERRLRVNEPVIKFITVRVDEDQKRLAKIEKHRAGDLYDLIKSSKETVKPAGQWNTARIVSNKGRYEFWLNGYKAVEFTMHDAKWDALVAGSKFKNMADFGKATKGHIALQDHGDKVWYRNIKIREIK